MWKKLVLLFLGFWVPINSAAIRRVCGGLNHVGQSNAQIEIYISIGFE
jgi:hypothetical protein